MFLRIINNIISFVINAYHPKPHWKRQEINRVWRDYRRGRIQCWHINAEDKRVHKTTINQNDILLTLTENEISILTEQMGDINKNDVIFLYENEDEGYVGVFKVVGLACMRIEQCQRTNTVYSSPKTVNFYLTEKGKSERLLSFTEVACYRLYSAVGNYSGYITCIMMSPLLISRQKNNPFGLLRYQLLRLPKDYVMNLLNYFDSDEV